MKALMLDATWEPKPTYTPTAQELKSRKAFNANAVWRAPKLELVERPIPPIADDEVLIKVRVCGVCGTDTHCYEKDAQGYVMFSGLARLPVILGHEFSGEIVEAGKNVKNLKTGDAVAAESILWCGLCASCRAGNLNQCRQLEMVGLSAPGAFAEYIAIKEQYCWKLDALRSTFQDDDQLFEAGALLEPIGCAYNALFISGGGFKPGAYVAVYGAGPIGLGAVMLARAAGASKIFVFDLNESRNKLALLLGGDYAASPVRLKQEETSPSEVIREMTDGYGADMQIEAAGAASLTVPEIEKSFAPNGRMIFLGRQDNYATLGFDTIISQANQIIGSRGQAGYGIYSNIIRLIAAKRIPAHKMITSRYPFDRAIDAVKQSTTRDDGKIMVRL